MDSPGRPSRLVDSLQAQGFASVRGDSAVNWGITHALADKQPEAPGEAAFFAVRVHLPC